MKPSELASLCTQNSDAWKSDWDVYLNPETLKILSHKCMVDESLIKRSSFYYNCDFFYNQTGETPQVKWVMPIGVRTHHKCHGIQYCPFCLIEDGDKPYFRRNWRLGFMTCCTFHHQKLKDSCPQCNRPIDIKRPKKRKDSAIYHPEDIVYCSNCDFDLRKTTFSMVSSDEYEINRFHFMMTTLGYGKVGSLEFNYSNLYFEGIRRLLSFIACSPKGEKLFLQLRYDLGLHQIYHRELIGHNIEPERLETGFRRTVLIMIYHLLQDWPVTFINMSQKSRITSHLIKTPYLEFPFWISEALFFNLKRKTYALSDTEKQNIVNFFEKRYHKKINPHQAARFVKYYLNM